MSEASQWAKVRNWRLYVMSGALENLRQIHYITKYRYVEIHLHEAIKNLEMALSKLKEVNTYKKHLKEETKDVRRP